MTVKQLENRIDDYFARCEETGEFPDYAGLKLSLGLTEPEVEELCSRGRSAPRFARAFERAKQRRESWLARRAVQSRGCLSLLGRPENGGYEDTEPGTGGIRVVIALEGLGGIESAK